MNHEHTWVEVTNYGVPTGFWYCFDISCAHSVTGDWVWSDEMPDRLRTVLDV